MSKVSLKYAGLGFFFSSVIGGKEFQIHFIHLMRYCNKSIKSFYMRITTFNATLLVIYIFNYSPDECNLHRLAESRAKKGERTTRAQSQIKMNLILKQIKCHCV